MLKSPVPLRFNLPCYSPLMVRLGILPFRAALHAARPKSTCISVHIRRQQLANQQRAFGISAQRNADDKNQSFKNQLYESTHQRLKRERAEQERFSQYQTQSSSGRYAALMFGMRNPSTPPHPEQAILINWLQHWYSFPPVPTISDLSNPQVCRHRQHHVSQT